MSADVVMTERKDAALVITMNRPDRRNATNLEMRHAMVAAIRRAESHPDVRAIVITGAGGHFSAGGDLSAPYEKGGVNRSRLEAMNANILAISNAKLPVIAAVDGVAYGVGLSLALACDLVVSSRGARFCAPFTGIGLTADGGLHHLLSRRAGIARATRMILLGRPIDAATASAWGVVDDVTDGDPLEAALDLADSLAKRAPLALAATRRILRGSATLSDALDQETDAQLELMETADFAEGRAAFFEKRTPVFRGA